jgi:hypothetical protein
LKREEVARLCPYCGEDLTALLAAFDADAPTVAPPPPPRPESAPPPAGSVIRDVPAGNFVIPTIPAPATPAPAAEREQSATVESQPPPIPATLRVENPHAAAGAAANGCTELLVEYNHAPVFLIGCKLNFEFRLTPQVEGISNVRIEVWDADTQERIAGQVLKHTLFAGEQENLSMAFAPEERHHGELNCDIRLSFVKQGARLCYRTQQKTHNVFRASDPPAKILDTLTINLTQNLDHSHANDFRLSMDELVSRMQQQRGTYAVNFADIKPPKVWGTLHFLPLAPQPVARALSLCFPKQCVHLLPGSQIRVGYHRENELVARIPNASKDDNHRISRFHCQILRVENEVFIKDGGAYPDGFRASVNGTFVNGEQLAPGGDYKVPPNKSLTLTLGDPDANDRRVFGLKMRLWRRMDIQDGISPTCGKGAPEELVALTMNARRDPQQWFVLLWRQFPLEKIDYSGVCLCKEPLGFLMQHAGVCEPLEPGRELDIGGQVVQVARYEKPWISTVR